MYPSSPYFQFPPPLKSIGIQTIFSPKNDLFNLNLVSQNPNIKITVIRSIYIQALKGGDEYAKISQHTYSTFEYTYIFCSRPNLYSRAINAQVEILTVVIWVAKQSYCILTAFYNKVFIVFCSGYKLKTLALQSSTFPRLPPPPSPIWFNVAFWRGI